jgi:hypothetical protein
MLAGRPAERQGQYERPADLYRRSQPFGEPEVAATMGFSEHPAEQCEEYQSDECGAADCSHEGPTSALFSSERGPDGYGRRADPCPHQM